MELHLGPKMANGTRGKMIVVGTIDRGSTVYVFGCKLSLFRLCDTDFGITPVDDITVRITCAAFCFHIAHISFASSWYLFCFSVIVLARLCVFGTAMSVKKVFFVFFYESYVRSFRRYCFVRNYAAVPVQLEIVILRYIVWCVLIHGLLSSSSSPSSANF